MAFCKLQLSLATLSLTLLAACGDSGPSTFNSTGMNGDLQAVTNVEDDNISQAFDGMEQVLGSDTISLNIASLASQRLSAEDSRTVATLLRTATARPAISASMAVPPAAAGKTFVWDSASASYVASDRTGAPASGVRVILYAEDNTGTIVTPLVETGYVDFTDLSSGSTRKGRLAAVVSGSTILDYTVTVTGDETQGEIKLDGYLVSAAGRLNVNFDLTGATGADSTTTFTLASALDLPSRNASFDFGMHGTSNSVTNAVHYALSETIKSPNGRLDVSGEGDAGADITLTIKVNGETWATLTGSTLTPADGHTLTAEDQQVLKLAGVLAKVGVLLPVGMIFPVAVLLGGFPALPF